MAETSKRNWPWKKKNQEKFASAPELIDSSPRASPHNSKFFDEQDVSKILSDHARVSDEAMTQWQHSESKLKQLSDKLNAAQTELTTRDILVKQHAKVAEEAVTGWEKAEAEASAMKKQLDTAIHQKLATEDRVSHLDGALKECMRQLRHVREEQEVKIHETIIKKTREYDKLRQDMEAKLAEAGHHLKDACSEALDSRAETHAMSITLQERTEALAEAMDVKACAETEITILQAQLQSMEKANSTLKYELHLLSKEVEIRNVERDCERRVAENAGKNQLENVKKIAKLEAECQKLRVLVRKKLPGPAALAQMKIEVDALGSNSTGVDLQRKRSFGRSASTSPRDLSYRIKSTHDTHDSYGTSRDADILSERLLEMDDELKMLKEALAKRDEELQASRLMCAKTASKLSNVEEQLENAADRSKRKSIDLCFTCQKEGIRKRNELAHPSNATPALFAELADFRKGADRELDVGKLDLMEDFTEIERLAMATEKSELHSTDDEASEKSFDAIAEIFEKKLIAKQTELEEANSMCKEVSQQLMHAREQLSIVQSRNGANEATLVRLQEKLDRLCDKQGEDDTVKDRNITKELEDLVEAQSISVKAGAANEVMLYDLKGRSQNAEEVSNGARRSMSSGSSSELRYEVSEHSTSVLSDAESKASTKGSDLLTTVRSVVQAVEALAQATGLEHEISSFNSGHSIGVGPDRHVYPFMQWKDSGLDRTMHSLIGISNKLLHGETDIVEFLVELTAVVNYLARICGRNLVHHESSGESQADWPSLKETEDEILRVFSSEVAMGCHTCPDVKLQEGFEDPDTAKSEIAEVVVRLDTAKRRVEGMDNQLHGTERPMSDGSNCRVDCELHELSLSNTELDRDMFMLLNKVVVLEEELEDEKRQRQEMVAKYHELQQNIHSGGAGIDSQGSSLTSEISRWGVSHSVHELSLDTEEIQVQKEGEIQSASEKLAECQRSILELGKQLKALSSPLDSLDKLCKCKRVSTAPKQIQNKEQTRLQLEAGESHFNSYVTLDHECTPSAYSNDGSLGWRNLGSSSVPCSLFLDWRRSPSPPLGPQEAGQNSSQFPLLSNTNWPRSEVQEGKRVTSHGGSMTSVCSPAPSESALCNSLNLSSLPEGSKELPSVGHRGTSPRRSTFFQSNVGNLAKESSNSSMTSFSRFNVKSARDG